MNAIVEEHGRPPPPFEPTTRLLLLRETCAIVIFSISSTASKLEELAPPLVRIRTNDPLQTLRGTPIQRSLA